MANTAARFRTGVWAALTIVLPWLAQAEPARWLTDNDAPFNLPDAHGGVTGISSEMVMFRRAGIDYRIEMQPWARAYNLAQIDPRACLFSTTRTPGREKLFVWIGPLLTKRYLGSP
ncbi:hypothetical protein [Chromobacterium alticapitis]|uniref:Solute-binding protein family 3/N-terminal domain-containing protein n=1 Tax=Chromobacterium alticapitis TaxID=2073169 RepID=A0A2S5DLB0_9NEIS|nr:hypothetical protein [Chromobacterium alticapitis]POZ63844.1 hypothetical protein C2I19_01485 [Chromobacterium alticapitis]